MQKEGQTKSLFENFFLEIGGFETRADSQRGKENHKRESRVYNDFINLIRGLNFKEMLLGNPIAFQIFNSASDSQLNKQKKF